LAGNVFCPSSVIHSSLTLSFWFSSQKLLDQIRPNLDVIFRKWSSSTIVSATLTYIQNGCHGFLLFKNLWKYSSRESLNEMKLHLSYVLLGLFFSTIMSVDHVNNPRWPPRLIMELLVFQYYLKLLTSDLTNIFKLSLYW
jgi:hypothetical protein